MDVMHTKLKLLRFLLKLERVFARLRPAKQIYLRDRIAQYKNIWNTIADEIDADFSEIDRDLWEFKKGNKTVRARLHELPLDNNIVLKLCGRKPLVYKLLAENGLPVPQYELFNLYSFDKALSFSKRFPLGSVVKPCDGYAGLGVTTHITHAKDLQRAAARASLYLDDLMIEQQIPGENFRLLVYKGRMLHAVRRPGCVVTGDGISTIRTLLEQQREKISSDADMVFTLASQGLTLDSVPAKNIKAVIRSVGNDFNGGIELRTVYRDEVTDIVHPSIKQYAEKCAEISQGVLVGVDIITLDITRDIKETGGIINEINTTPAFHHHYDENTAPYPWVCRHIVDDLFSH